MIKTSSLCRLASVNKKNYNIFFAHFAYFFIISLALDSCNHRSEQIQYFLFHNKLVFEQLLHLVELPTLHLAMESALNIKPWYQLLNTIHTTGLPFPK
jgi:hypothetical protein